MHATIYLLNEMKAVYRLETLSPPQDFQRQTLIADGSVVEDYHLVDSRADLLPQNIKDRVKAHRDHLIATVADTSDPDWKDRSMVSVVHGAFSCLLLDFHPAETYNLSVQPDPDLMAASASLLVKMSAEAAQPVSIGYSCTRGYGTDGWFGRVMAHVGDHFQKRGLSGLRQNLATLLGANESGFMLWVDTDGKYWAVIGEAA